MSMDVPVLLIRSKIRAESSSETSSSVTIGTW